MQASGRSIFGANVTLSAPKSDDRLIYCILVQDVLLGKEVGMRKCRYRMGEGIIIKMAQCSCSLCLLVKLPLLVLLNTVRQTLSGSLPDPSELILFLLCWGSADIVQMVYLLGFVGHMVSIATTISLSITLVSKM